MLSDPGWGSCNLIVLLCVICCVALCCMGEASRLCAMQHSMPTSLAEYYARAGNQGYPPLENDVCSAARQEENRELTRHDEEGPKF